MFRPFIYNVFSSIDGVCLHDLARHFKTEPTETVAFCFGIPARKYPVHLPSQLILCVNKWLDEEGSTTVLYSTQDYYKSVGKVDLHHTYHLKNADGPKKRTAAPTLNSYLSIFVRKNALLLNCVFCLGE
jgi:hypothetical protein